MSSRSLRLAMMMPETEESLEGELRRTRTMLEPIDRQIAELEARPRRSGKEEKTLAELREHRQRALEGLRAVEHKLAELRQGKG